MKICPRCQKSYPDDLFFCLDDGTSLEEFRAAASSDEVKTRIVPDSNFKNQQTTRHEQENPRTPIHVDSSNPPKATVTVPTQNTPSSNAITIGIFFLLAVMFLVVGLAGGAGLYYMIGIDSDGVETSEVIPTQDPSHTRISTPEKDEDDEPIEEETPEESTDETPKETETVEDDLDDLYPIAVPQTPEKPKACYLHDGGKGGGEVRVRRYCDNGFYDCSKDRATIAGQFSNGTPIKKLGGSVRTGGFKWVKISVRGSSLWVASSKIRCD